MNRKSITCSNGHHLRAAGALSGKTLPCPKCGVAVTIPWEEAFTVPEEPPRTRHAVRYRRHANSR